MLVAGRAHRGGRRGARRPRARAARRGRRRPFRQARHAPASSTRTSTIRRPRSSAPMARNSSTGCTNTPSSRSRNSPIPATRDGSREFFLDELFRCGTTTAMVYCTVHPQSVDAFFAESRAARRAHDRGQGDDGPRRAGGAHGHRPARLRREQGADRALARPRPARLCDHAALRGHLEQAQLEAAGALAREFPRRLRADASRRKQRRDRAASPALFPRRESYLDVYDRAGPARAALGVRPLHPSARTSEVAALAREPIRSPPSARRRTCSSARACSIRRGSSAPACGLRSRPTSAAAPAIRCCAPRRRATRCCR